MPGKKSSRKRNKPAPKKKPASPRPTSLNDEAAYASMPDELPDYAVADVLHEARDLATVIKKVGPRLIEGSDLDASAHDDLVKRAATLEANESAWYAARHVATPSEVKQLRASLEVLKKEAFSALRYFGRKDAGLRIKLDDIAPGTGDADLIDDAKKLGDLVEQHSALLKQGALPADIAERLRAEAAALGDALADRSHDEAAARALTARNRSYWHLVALMDDIRAAGRYVFRHEPKRLVLFQATSTRARKRPAAKPSEPTPAP